MQRQSLSKLLFAIYLFSPLIFLECFRQVIAVFVAIGIIFIPVGLVSLSASEHVICFKPCDLLNQLSNELICCMTLDSFMLKQVVEIVQEYDADCIPLDYRKDKVGYIQSDRTNKTCTLSMTVSQNS